MDYAIMFDVMKDGEIIPIKWGGENRAPNKSLIILDESTLSIYLWHGKQRGLVERRIALRQAESLKGHGYTTGDFIIGIDIKTLKEIDDRKVGKEPETTELNEDLEEVLSRKITPQEGFLVSFGEGETKPIPKKRPSRAVQDALKEQADLRETEKQGVKPVKTEVKKAEPKKSQPTKAKSIRQAEPITEIGGSSEFAILSRLDSIESKLEDLFKIFNDLATTIKEDTNPHFVTNLKAMKDRIQNNENLDGAPNYPSRDEMVKDKIKK